MNILCHYIKCVALAGLSRRRVGKIADTQWGCAMCARILWKQFIVRRAFCLVFAVRPTRPGHRSRTFSRHIYYRMGAIGVCVCDSESQINNVPAIYFIR